MKRLAKITSVAATIAVCIGMSASVSAFSDMPDGAMGEALQSAVNAGLMDGVTDDLIARKFDSLKTSRGLENVIVARIALNFFVKFQISYCVMW